MKELREVRVSLASAQQFVARMKADKEFRAAVQQVADVAALNDCLRDQGFDFNQRELVGAMAACMTELDTGSPNCCS
jgi:predicted ribosomally synthesized peptide with nif11-like leader